MITASCVVSVPALPHEASMTPLKLMRPHTTVALRARHARMSESLARAQRAYTPVAFQLRLSKGDLSFHRALGVGTFGKVFLVSHREKRYALKQIGKAQVAKKGLVTHVKREKELMCELSGCPFIVNMCGAFQDDQSLYLLMEAVMGGELFYYLQAHRQPLSEPCAPCPARHHAPPCSAPPAGSARLAATPREDVGFGGKRQ